MSEIELRPFFDGVEVRSGDGGHLVLSGVAIKYGARSKDLGGFRERVMPGAATEAIQKGDVHAYEEHRSNRYLGRTGNGTLRLIDSRTELRYEVDIPDTAVGREVAALAQRGDYAGSSWGFRALSDSWSKDEDGFPLRTITAFRSLRDVGPTVAPAYGPSTTEMALRSLADALAVEVRSVLDAAAAGTLTALLDGEPPTPPAPLEPPPPIEPPAPIDPPPDPVVIHRRPTHWFI